DRDQTCQLRGRLGLITLLAILGRYNLTKVHTTAGRRFERFILKGANRRYPELVDRVGHQQHFDTAGAESFELRALLDDIEAVAGDRVDRLLPRLHSLHIFVQRYEPVPDGRTEAG